MRHIRNTVMRKTILTTTHLRRNVSINIIMNKQTNAYRRHTNAQISSRCDTLGTLRYLLNHHLSTQISNRLNNITQLNLTHRQHSNIIPTKMILEANRHIIRSTLSNNNTVLLTRMTGRIHYRIAIKMKTCMNTILLLRQLNRHRTIKHSSKTTLSMLKTNSNIIINQRILVILNLGSLSVNRITSGSNRRHDGNRRHTN